MKKKALLSGTPVIILVHAIAPFITRETNLQSLNGLNAINTRENEHASNGDSLHRRPVSNFLSL